MSFQYLVYTLLGAHWKTKQCVFLPEAYYEANETTDWAAYSLLYFEGKYSLIPLLKISVYAQTQVEFMSVLSLSQATHLANLFTIKFTLLI